MSEIDFFDFTKEPGKELKGPLNVKIDKPRVSIITGFYNVEEKLIMQTANSIFNQTFPYWEWIIVDDCSKDEYKKILEKLEAMDGRIKVVHNEKNMKLPKTRDIGISHASSDFIYILDGDDLIENTAIETAYFAAMTHPEVTWVYSDSVGFEGEEYLWKHPFDTNQEKKENMLCCNSLIRKQAILDVGGYSNVPKDVYEDWHLWLRLIANGAKPLRMSHYAFWYRRHKNGVLSGINSDKAKKKKALKEIERIGKSITKKANAIQYPNSDYYPDYSSHPKDFEFDAPYIQKEKNNKRILCIFPWLTLGGADKYNLNLLEKLYEEGYETTIVTTVPSEYVWRPRFEKYATEIFDLTTFLDKPDWAGFISYLIKSRNIDLTFVSNSTYGYYLVPWLKLQYPQIPIIDYIHMEEWHWRDGGFPRDSIAVDKYIDYTYTCSRYLIDIMKEKMNKKNDKMDVVYIGTDEEQFNPDLVGSPDDEELKKLEGKKKVLFACRIAEQKRPILMIKILKKICDKRKDIGFVVVGDGNMLPTVKELAYQYNIEENVAFLGVKKDVRPYYKICDATLICSMIEGLALTTYESLAMNTPVITADVGGQKELVNEEVGRIVKLYQDPNTDINNYDYSDEEIDAYVEAIEDVIDNNDKYKKNCRERILRGFTIKNMQENMLSIIKNKIEEGTNISYDDIKADYNMAERMLVLYNEATREEYDNPDDDDIPLKQKIGNVMWKYKFYRDMIYFVKRTKGDV